MPRYRFTVEYDGGPFVGWQRQDNGVSVQAVLERAIHAASGETVTVIAAGRTDTGVHALGQVVHVDLEGTWEPFRLGQALNYHMKPNPVAIVGAQAAAPGFHARFSAIGRRYRYRIVNRRAPLTLDQGRALPVTQQLDADAMHAAAQLLVGHHDFTSFRASQCQAKSPFKTLDRLDVTRMGEEVWIDAAARSFLHHQVRNMTGTLLQVGLGRWTAERVAAARDARDRRAGGPTAPPSGLYLTAVEYGEEQTNQLP
jgi:tRNA pseudouridine38-40 synthase